MMKKAYIRPSLVQYGSVEQLTLGSGGAKPDYSFPNFNLINNSCDASDPVTACLVSS